MEWIEDIKNSWDDLALGEILQNKNGIFEKLKEDLIASIQLSSEDENNTRLQRTMDFGIACLQIFVMENWTGPALLHEIIPEKLKYIFSEEFGELISNDLQQDGDVVHGLSKNVGLFWFAYLILVEMADRFSKLKKCKIWTLRCLAVYQELLEEKSTMLNEKFLSIIDGNEESPSFEDRETEAEFHLECVHLHLQYYGYNKAKEHLERARNLLGLEVSLTGALGKRTKFQQTDLAQLRLDVKLTIDNDRSTTTTTVAERDDLPTDATLDDDTLLTDISYSDATKLPQLRPIEQAYILTDSILRQRTTPKDNLLLEEILPYLRAATKVPQSWAVQFKALHMRSILESKGRRTVERSMMQMQHLVDEFAKEKPAAEKRMHLLHSVALSPHWITKANFGRILMSLGCTKSALEIFERIQAWEDVITCHSKLGRHEKAENIIRQQLDVKETAKLWCLLGDVTENIEFYEKAWEFSKHRSARAQRSLGFYYLRKGKFEECIPCFQKSLEISSLQPQVWFSLGCSGIATKQFDIAQKGFQRFVTIEPDNHEAWNNLSTVFIRTNQKRKAFKALQEAIKSNYSSWQIWENFLLVSIDLGEFREAIKAIHMLLDLKKKEVDVEVLGILVRSVTSDVKDAIGEPASKLIPKVKELFGRITAQITNNPGIWHHYGDLYFQLAEPDSADKALGFYMKAHRCYVQNPSWEKDAAKVANVIETYSKLIKSTEKIKNENKNPESDTRSVSSTRMAVSNFLKRFDAVYPDGLSKESELKNQDALEALRQEVGVL